jgi:hypothetical protein
MKVNTGAVQGAGRRADGPGGAAWDQIRELAAKSFRGGELIRFKNMKGIESDALARFPKVHAAFERLEQRFGEANIAAFDTTVGGQRAFVFSYGAPAFHEDGLQFLEVFSPLGESKGKATTRPTPDGFTPYDWNA